LHKASMYNGGELFVTPAILACGMKASRLSRAKF